MKYVIDKKTGQIVSFVEGDIVVDLEKFEVKEDILDQEKEEAIRNGKAIFIEGENVRVEDAHGKMRARKVRGEELRQIVEKSTLSQQDIKDALQKIIEILD